MLLVLENGQSFMIKRVDENGKVEFYKHEAIDLLRQVGYKCKKNRLVKKVFKKLLSEGLRKLMKQYPDGLPK